MDKANKPPRTWGVSASEFYAGLQDKTILLMTVHDIKVKGTLLGVDLYDIVIRQPNGIPILLAKHSIRSIQADPPDKANP